MAGLSTALNDGTLCHINIQLQTRKRNIYDAISMNDALLPTEGDKTNAQRIPIGGDARAGASLASCKIHACAQQCQCRLPKLHLPLTLARHLSEWFSELRTGRAVWPLS